MDGKPSENSFHNDSAILENIIQGTSIPTFVINRSHVITHWNRACENLTGIAAGDIIGTKNQWRAFYSKERPVMADLIVGNASEAEITRSYGDKFHKSRVIEGAYEAEDFFPDLGEKGKWLFFTAAPLKDLSGTIKGAIETLQDITHRKQAEQSLRESEERYRVLTEYVADGVMLIQECKLVFTNHALNAMFGHEDPAQMLGRNVVNVFPGDLQKHITACLRASGGGTTTENVFESPCFSDNGREFWVEIRMTLIHLYGNPAVLATVRDVTESRRQRIAMEEEAAYLRQENIRLRSSVKDRYRFGNIIGKSKPMQEVYELILKAASTDAHVIISGESGTGKELVAHAIHSMSDRQDNAFVPVNCGAIPENLIESEFFGYKKGAFTGAAVDKIGYLDLADKGVLFLDEIGEIGVNLQVKLLRAIEEGGFTPVGGSEVRKPNIRVIAATNKNLSEMVNKGLMRRDFYYRINIIPIHLPPLRERKEDLPLLMDHFMRKFGDVKTAPTVTGNIIEAFIHYDWPGNVRELQNVLHRFLTLRKIDLPATVYSAPDNMTPAAEEGDSTEIPSLQAQVENFEKNIILNTLRRCQWHRGKAASILDVDRKTLYSKIKRYNIDEPEQ